MTRLILNKLLKLVTSKISLTSLFTLINLTKLLSSLTLIFKASRRAFSLLSKLKNILSPALEIYSSLSQSNIILPSECFSRSSITAFLISSALLESIRPINLNIKLSSPTATLKL